jgi:uncharacterized protein
MKMSHKIIMGTLMLATLQLTACAQRQTPQQQLNMHNPAADWCVRSGGKLSKVVTEAGVTGYCTLPSGELIEQWALYHRDHAKKG